MIKKFLKNWWYVILLSLAVIVVALVLRTYHITQLPVFADEAIYIRWSQVMKAEPTLRFLPLSDGKQPLFMWLVIPLLKIFSDPLVTGRLVSAFSGVGTLVGIFALSYLLFKSKKVSLMATLIYAVSPFSVFFERLALADALLAMFGVWTLFFAILASKNYRLDFAMLAGFSLGGALLTKSPALFFSLLIPVSWLLVVKLDSLKKAMIHLIKLVFLFIPTYSIAYGLYNILRLGPNFNLISSRNMDYVYPISHFLTDPKDPFLPLFDRSFEWIRMMGPWPIIFLAAIGIFLTGRKYIKEKFLLGVWFIGPILVQSEFAKVYTARYILFTLPYLAILAALAFISGKFINQVSILILLLFVFLSLKFDLLLLMNVQVANLPRSERSGYLEEWTAGTGIKEVSDYLINQYQTDPGQKIVVGTEGFFGTLPDGLQIYLNSYPQITVIGVGLNFDILHPSLVNAKKAGDRTFLVVNSSRFHNNPDKLGLKLISSYSKATKPDGSMEELLFYEVENEAKNLPTKNSN